jgi:hypothetical protein
VQDECEWMRKEAVVAYFKTLSGTRMEGLRKPQIMSIRIFCVPSEIRSSHIPNTIRKRTAGANFPSGLCDYNFKNISGSPHGRSRTGSSGNAYDLYSVHTAAGTPLAQTFRGFPQSFQTNDGLVH